jgi:hypothetical protein
MKIKLTIELDDFVVYEYLYYIVFTKEIQYRLYEDGGNKECISLTKRLKKVYENQSNCF